jgi:hypothetical protein
MLQFCSVPVKYKMLVLFGGALEAAVNAVGGAAVFCSYSRAGALESNPLSAHCLTEYRMPLLEISSLCTHVLLYLQ